MRILRDHFLKEFGRTFAACLLLLLMVFLAGRGLVKMADLVFNRDVDPLLVGKLFLYTTPFLLTFVIPMSVLMATLFTFGKLSHDNEITAVRASGVSIFRASLPILAAVLVLSAFSYLLSDRVASTAHYAYRRLFAQIGIESPAAALEEGTFVKKFKNFIIFVYEIDKTKLKGIRIYQPQEGGPTRTIIAERGEIISVPEKNLLILSLSHGTSDEPDARDPSKLYKLTFKSYDLPLNIATARDVEDLGKKPKDMTVNELKDEIKRLGEDGIEATYPLAAEIHNKLALALSSIAFVLLGIPLGITTRRTEKSINFGIALVLMTAYWTLLIGGKALAQKGIAPPFISLQFANFLVGGAGAFLFARMARN